MKDIFERFAALKASPWITDDLADSEALASVEERLGIALPPALKAVLEHYGAAITFGTEVHFRPDTPSGWEDKEGSLSISTLYGIRNDDWSIVKRNVDYDDQVPENCIVIGESPGGNQICIDRDSGSILFWDHESNVQEASSSIISESFDSFIERLYPVDDAARLPTGVITSKSYLNF